MGGAVLHLRGALPHGEIDIQNDGSGTVERAFSVQQNERHEIVATHEIVARSAKRVFSYPSDLTSASATGIGPFFSGRLSYRATAPETDLSGPSGPITGKFKAAFAVPSQFTVPSGTRASLYFEGG
jgi:hypothetical protein